MAFTLFWLVGGVEIADEGVRGSGGLIDYVLSLVTCMVFVVIGIAAAVSGWRLRPGKQ